MTNRNRTSTPVIPFIQLYDSGTQTFTSAGEFHTWDTVAFKTSDLHYTADDDRILVNIPSAGYYEITFECSLYRPATGFSVATTQAYKNGVALPGAIAIGCSYNSGQGLASCACITLHYIVYLKARDYIQIKTTASINQDMISSVETSRLLVKFLPTQGWNNNNGGNTNYRGRVNR